MIRLMIAVMSCIIFGYTAMAAEISLLRAVPEEAQIVAYASNFENVMRSLRQSPLGNDSLEEASKNTLPSSLDKALKNVWMVFETIPEDQRAMLLGSECMLVTLKPDAEHEDDLWWACVIRHKLDEGTQQMVAAAFSSYAEKNAAKTQQKSKDDVKISVLRGEQTIGQRLFYETRVIREVKKAVPKTKDTANLDATFKLVQQEAETRYEYVGNDYVVYAVASSQAVQSFMNRLDNPQGVPSRTKLHAELAQEGTPDVEIHASGKDLEALLKNYAKREKEMQWLKIDALRLSEIDNAGLGVYFKPLQTQALLALSVRPNPQGVMKLLMLPEVSSKPLLTPPNVGNAAGWARLSTPLPRLLSEIRILLATVQPAGKIMLDVLAGQYEQKTGLSFDQTVINAFGDQIGCVFFDKSDIESYGFAKMVDNTSFKKALPELIASGPAQFLGNMKIEEENGISSVVMTRKNDKKDTFFSYAFDNTMFLFSEDTDDLRQARSMQSSPAELSDLTKLLPSQRFGEWILGKELLREVLDVDDSSRDWGQAAASIEHAEDGLKIRAIWIY